MLTLAAGLDPIHYGGYGGSSRRNALSNGHLPRIASAIGVGLQHCIFNDSFPPCAGKIEDLRRSLVYTALRFGSSGRESDNQSGKSETASEHVTKLSDDFGLIA